MTTILAHRANLTGPHSVAENSLAACAAALAAGFGGWKPTCDAMPDGAFYTSVTTPMRATPENSLEAYTALFRQYPNAELAINVKELGYEKDLIELMRSGRSRSEKFLF